MSREIFGPENADLYDLLYSDKDYEAECDMLERIFRRYGTGPVQNLLDLGCGTGGHALPLAHRGYRVTGVDRSQAMLSRAQHKAGSVPWHTAQAPPTFLRGDMRSLDLNRQFDAVLMMFAALGYQLTNDDVLAALRTVRRHLRPGGLLVGDVWYGPAVLALRLQERVKVIPTKDGKVIRAASGSLDTYRHLAEIRYSFSYPDGPQILREAEEIHQMRYFFPQELSLFLAQADLNLMGLQAFGTLEAVPGEDTWNILVIAKSPQSERDTYSDSLVHA